MNGPTRSQRRDRPDTESASASCSEDFDSLDLSAYQELRKSAVTHFAVKSNSGCPT